ncbi:ATP-dependent DNA helicase DinG [Microbacteriaceae bacterium 4G12]
MNNRYVVVDLETTGNIAKDGVDKITQIAAVVIEDGEIQEIFSSFVNPERSIPSFITELTGIDDSIVKQAPHFREIAPMIVELLENSYFVAHNVHFDWNFLKEELKNAGFPVIHCPKLDTVELARILFPTADSYKLGDLAKKFQLEHENPHRADSDATVTAQLFFLLYNKLESLPSVTLQSLYQLSRSFKSDVGELLSSLIVNKMMDNSDDTEFDVYRSLALRKRNYAVQLEDCPAAHFDSFQEAVSSFKQEMTGFEEREGQMMMMEEVYSAFLGNRFSCIEAGTGTGKTLAYLLPSIFFAKEKEEPVIISTQTVQLQQQIMEKEIPLLKEMIPFPFEIAVIKGRKHYLCLHKFEYVLAEEDTNYDSILTKAKLLVWLLDTEAGDVDELNLPTGGKLLWERICSDANSPTGKQNPWNSRCFYQRAKHRVVFADLIITNHALLFQDITNEEPLLSSYKYVILDEAHHIEEVASHMLGDQFSCMYFQSVLSRFGTLETEDMLTKLYEMMKKRDEAVLVDFQEMSRLLKDVKFESDELFRMLRAFVLEKNQTNMEGNVRLLSRYDIKQERSKLWKAIVEATDRLSHVLKQLLYIFEAQVQLAKQQKDWEGNIVIEECLSLLNTFVQVKASLESLLLQEHVDGVTWMEADTKGTIHSTILYKQPLDMSDLLADHFFTEKKSVILTSATLTVNGTFDYMLTSLGLTDFHPSVQVVPSLFQYDQQVQMMIPTDLPNIKHVSEEEYTAAIAQDIAEIAKVTKGKMLVLFTSYEMLRQAYKIMKDREDLAEFVLLAQGVNSGSRARLTKNFQQFEKAILFGTNSFWEGIDIPGEDLSCLVMVRLPFSPPNHPILAAKSEKMKEVGKNAFMELALPQAILRFKQGFGRLIRTQQDQGTFFVLDRRITTTFYGKRFISSIPKVPIYEKPLHELLLQMEER